MLNFRSAFTLALGADHKRLYISPIKPFWFVMGVESRCPYESPTFFHRMSWILIWANAFFPLQFYLRNLCVFYSPKSMTHYCYEAWVQAVALRMVEEGVAFTRPSCWLKTPLRNSDFILHFFPRHICLKHEKIRAHFISTLRRMGGWVCSAAGLVGGWLGAVPQTHKFELRYCCDNSTSARWPPSTFFSPFARRLATSKVYKPGRFFLMKPPYKVPPLAPFFWAFRRGLIFGQRLTFFFCLFPCKSPFFG